MIPYGTKRGGDLQLSSPFTDYSDISGGQAFVQALGDDSKIENLTSQNEELINWIPQTMEKDPYDFNDKYVIGMGIKTENGTQKIHSWFNGEAYHSIASRLVHYKHYNIFSLRENIA